jgi:hypothetical protein
MGNDRILDLLADGAPMFSGRRPKAGDVVRTKNGALAMVLRHATSWA